MKTRHFINLLILLTFLTMIMFWLTRYSVFNDHVSLEYEDWARGALLEDDHEFSKATTFWAICSSIGLTSLLIIGLYRMASRFYRL